MPIMAHTEVRGQTHPANALRTQPLARGGPPLEIKAGPGGQRPIFRSVHVIELLNFQVSQVSLRLMVLNLGPCWTLPSRRSSIRHMPHHGSP